MNHSASPQPMFFKTRTFMEMIKISHTLFALPFAIGAAFVAAKGLPTGFHLLQIALAVFFARTAAMSFNRLVDRKIDAANPRTQGRAIPAGLLSARAVLLATIVSTTGFVFTCWWINPLALALSPVALLVALGYSLTKRFTALCHAVLGLALSFAPIGAWVVVTGELHWTPALLGLSVLLWTTGFDILYACLDQKFDCSQKLHSIPVRLGIPRALKLAALLHLLMAACLISLAFVAELGNIYLGAVALVIGLLLYEHHLVKPDDLTRVNRAFFHINGIVSITLMAALILSSLT